MTVIGKMLVFLVLVLAVVWNALVVNAYVTRTNWKKQADDYKAEAAKASESAFSLRKLIDAEREAAEDKARVIAEDRDRVYQQLQTARRSAEEINKAYQDRQKADREVGAQANQLEANLATALKQVEDLTKLLAQKEKTIDDQTLKAERATADMVKAQIEADQQKRRAEQLNETVLRQQELIADGRSPNRANPLVKTTPAPANLRGTIRGRSGDLVSFTPGLDAGLQVGALLDVYRTTGGGKWLGRVRVTHVDAKEAVGHFEPKPGATAADYPQAGDQLKPD